MPIIDQTKLPKEITDKYSIVNNAFRLSKIKNAELDKYTNTPKDLITAEVGDVKQIDFYPQLKLARWGDNEEVGEVNFSLRLIDDETGQETVNTLADKIVWEKGNKKIEFYDFVEGEGGYKLVWFLKKKPKTNKVNFTFQSKNLNFYLQPPLTQEFQSGYSEKFKKEIVVTETDVKDLEGNTLVHRPIEVVGSYVFYHQTKGGIVDAWGKDYKTGQAGVIYRPHLFDANDAEAWGILHIENGIYSVEIPQDFLDTAVYPIKSNDTFGYTTIGGTANSWFYDQLGNSSDNLQAVKGLPAGAGTVTTASFYGRRGGLTPAGVNSKIAIYGGTGLLVPSSNAVSINNTTAQWWVFNFTGGPTVSNITSYVAILVDSSTIANSANAGIYYYNTGSSGDSQYYATGMTYDTFPNPLAGSSSTGLKSIYATYTPSGGGGVNTPSTLSMLGVGM